MKKLLLSLLVLTGLTAAAQVKVGDNPTTIGSSSLLELESTNKVLLLPRITSTALVTTPVNGMVLYHTNQKCFKGYQDGAWVNITTCSSNTAALTVASPTYQGTSVIDATGIGYNGEQVPAASTKNSNKSGMWSLERIKSICQAPIKPLDTVDSKKPSNWL